MKRQCERCGEEFERTLDEYEMDCTICDVCYSEIHREMLQDEDNYMIRLEGDL